jgi:hypothetical protein
VVKAEPSVTQTVTVPALEDDPNGGGEPMTTKDESTSSSWPMQKTWAIVAGGAGVVLAGVGTVLYLGGKSTYNDSSSHCAGNICDQQGVDLRDSGNSKAKTGSILLGVGLVGIAAGAVLWFTAPSGASTTATGAVKPVVRVGVTPWGAMLEGRF